MIQLAQDCRRPTLPMGLSLIDWLIYTQEEMLGVSRDIQLVQRFSTLGLSSRAEAMVLSLAHEMDPKGDIVCVEDEEEEFWSANE